MRSFTFTPAASGPGIAKINPHSESGKLGAVASKLEVRGLLPMLDEVCAIRGVTRADICGRSRMQSAAHARAEVWFLMRTFPERAYSSTEIGAIFDRDHTTVLTGIKGHIRRMVGAP